MFKNLTIYTLTGADKLDAGTLQDALGAKAFVPCLPSNSQSIGFVPPREPGGPLLEVVAGQWIARLAVETKTVPAEAVCRALDEKVAQIEAATGRRPGKKERRALIDDIRTDLLPRAFPRRRDVLIWIDRANGRLLLDTASAALSDIASTEMVRVIHGLTLAPLHTTIHPTKAMTDLLVYDDCLRFELGRGCALQGCDEEKAVVTYRRHAIYTDEVETHIKSGKLPTRLDLTYDGRVDFTLRDNGVLTGIKLLDVCMDGQDEAGFDADVAIATGELGT